MNLYGFANGDPVNFSDPFGLSPDTLRFESPEAETATRQCAAESAQCARMVSELDADAAIVTVRTESLRSPNPGTAAMDYEFDASGNVTGIRGGTVTLDPRNLRAATGLLGVPVTNTTVLGHEFGHVVGNIVLFKQYGVRQPHPCRQTCANVFEAIVRREAGLRPRP